MTGRAVDDAVDDAGEDAGEPTLRVLDDATAASQSAAVAIAAALRDADAVRGRADWATTGGSSPVGIYRALRVAPLRDVVPWATTHVWWGDDRYVPREDKLSNVRPLDHELLPRRWNVPLPAENVHTMQMDEAIASEAGTAWVAEAYADELRAAGIPIGGNGMPALDLVLLGIGGDGHLLSVFPGSPLLDSTAWASPVEAPTHIEPHVARVSLNPGIVASARRVIVVVTGAAKASVLAEIFGPERDVRRWPAQLARRSTATWVLDREAAAQLPR
ncbi:MAG TPA: 6-phosphogluconolactonase [Candidatus Limnocylindrales bacterium]|nr:6-phosphogluconolactonase [Candidatus Limnocylindrales bacterium]